MNGLNTRSKTITTLFEMFLKVTDSMSEGGNGGQKKTTGCFLTSWRRWGVHGMLSRRHGDGLGDKLVAQGSGRPSVQVLGHDGDLAEVSSSQRVFVFDPADERRLVRLNTHTGGRVFILRQLLHCLTRQTERRAKKVPEWLTVELHLAYRDLIWSFLWKIFHYC